MSDNSLDVEVSPTLPHVTIPNFNFGNMAKRYMSSFVVQVGDVISMMDNLRLRAKDNIQLSVHNFANTDIVGKLTVSYIPCHDKLKLFTDNNLELNSCQEIKVKAGDAIEFEPSGYCKKLGICSNECDIKLWATDNLKIESCGDIRLRPECGNVISLQNNTEVPCGHDISFLESGSAINFSDSSYITTAGSRVIGYGSDHTIELSDNGQTLWMYTGYTVYIPLNSDIAFPIGARISIASGGYTVYVTRANESVTIVGNEYGSYGGSAASWYIPAYMKAEIIKVDTNYWLLSGPRLFVND
jgi:hypothetical protein